MIDGSGAKPGIMGLMEVDAVAKQGLKMRPRTMWCRIGKSHSRRNRMPRNTSFEKLRPKFKHLNLKVLCNSS